MSSEAPAASQTHLTEDEKTLHRLGYALAPLKTREIAKLDAGLSCMSLRWWAR